MPKQMEEAPVADWTCSRCDVTVSWMAEVERPEMPANWSVEGEDLYCLSCRREMAGEAGLAAAPEGANAADRQKLQSAARVEFELKRNPERQDNRIANSCHTSVVLVRKARARLGLESRAPG